MCNTLLHQLQLHVPHLIPHKLSKLLLLQHLPFLQALCSAVQHHLDLVSKLQQQMWAALSSTAQVSSANTLLGLRQDYMRMLGAVLTLAAPTSMKGMQLHLIG